MRVPGIRRCGLRRGGAITLTFSTRVVYGVHALLELAQRAGDGPVQSAEIARRQGIPEPYLTQLLAALRKAGLVASRRGPAGGHTLARPAQDITLAAIVIAMDGPLGAGAESEGGSAGDDVLLPIWDELAETVTAFLAGITLADLVERSRHDIVSYQI